MATVEAKFAGTADQKLKDLELGVRTGMLRSGAFLVARSQRVFQMFAPKGHATGQLLRSLKVTSPVLVNGWWRCRVGPGVKHGWWMHQGTGPAAGHGARRPPPVEPIYLWIKEKGIVPTTVASQTRLASGRFGKGYVVRRRKAKDIEKERRQLAFLIARKIGRVGTKPFPFLISPFKLYKAEMEKIIIASILQSLRRG